MNGIWQYADLHKDKKHKIDIVCIHGQLDGFGLMWRRRNLIFDLRLGKRLFADRCPVKKIIFFVGRIAENSGNNPFLSWRNHKRTPQAIERRVLYAPEKIIGGLNIVPYGDSS
jgi:hypothetical protein